jgi:hypothetical protein
LFLACNEIATGATCKKAGSLFVVLGSETASQLGRCLSCRPSSGRPPCAVWRVADDVPASLARRGGGRPSSGWLALDAVEKPPLKPSLGGGGDKPLDRWLMSRPGWCLCAPMFRV